MNFLRSVSPGAYRPVCAITSSIRFHVRVWPTSPSARAIDSRSVLGWWGPTPVVFGKFAIKSAKPARFISGAELVDNTKLAATSFASVIVTEDGDGDGAAGAPPVVRGVSSRLIVFLSTAARAGAWREFRLTTPPRGVGVGVGV